MNEKPILFSGPMVRAILAGRKTQTRRVLRQQPGPDISPDVLRRCVPMRRGKYEFMGTEGHEISIKPYCFPGDRLWVRETWCPAAKTGYDSPNDGRPGCGDDDSIPFPIWYRATDSGVVDTSWDGGWNPSIFMPRWASRITLEVVSVRVEWLQDISEEDCVAEGIQRSDDPGLKSWPWLGVDHPVKGTPKVFPFAWQAYQSLWDSINAKRGYGWDKNPPVWRIEFGRVYQ